MKTLKRNIISIVLILTILIGIIPFTTTEADAATAKFSYSVKITERNLRMRTGAGTNYTSVGYVKPGTYKVSATVAGSGSKSGWVKLPNGRYVSMDYCKPTENAYKVNVQVTQLNMRTGPGTNYSYVRGVYIPKGNYTITQIKGGKGSTLGWGYVKEKKYWISLDYVVPGWITTKTSSNTKTTTQTTSTSTTKTTTTSTTTTAKISQADLIIKAAESYVGMNLAQTKNKMKANKVNIWRQDYNYHWCAWFVSNCARQAGISTSVVENNTYADRDFYMKNGTYKWSKYRGGNYTPKKGDLIFFDWNGDNYTDHVGLVRYTSGNIVYTVEGNSSNLVKQRSYYLTSSYIIGYAAPKYK